MSLFPVYPRHGRDLRQGLEIKKLTTNYPQYNLRAAFAMARPSHGTSGSYASSPNASPAMGWQLAPYSQRRTAPAA